MPLIISLPVVDGDSLSALRTEVLARGFDYLEDNTARVDRAINTAISKVCRQDAWPFLSASGSNDEVLTIGPHYGHPEDVRHDNLVLQRRTREELAAEGADLTREGSPHSYYLDEGDTITPYPIGTGVVSAVWRFRPSPLEGDDDLCVVPSDYSDVVIDCAVRELEKDRHNWQAVQALAVEFEVQIAEMRDSLLEQQALVPYSPGDFA